MMTKLFWILSNVYIMNVMGLPQQDNVVYFPSDDGGISQIMNQKTVVQVVPPSVNLAEIRGTTQYENYVNNIIALGIGKITLAINKILMENEHAADNVVFSPTSIAGVLALVLLGANGKTYDELLNFMGLTSGLPDLREKPRLIHIQLGRIINKLIATSGFKIGEDVNYAMAIFVQNDYPIRPLYQQTAMEIYKSQVLNVDFWKNPQQAQRLVNEWVSRETRNKINGILNDVPSQYTKVILTSAMYFKAAWEHPFYPRSTMRRPFYVNGRNQPTNVKADMMANGGWFPYYNDLTLNCEILGFPYQGNRSVMYVVMPKNSNKENLKKLVGQLTSLELNNLADSTVPREAVILFPKMKLESTIDLKDALQLLGVRSLFDPQQANLALLSAGQVGNRIGIDPNISTNVTNVTQPNCTKIIDAKSNLTACKEDILTGTNKNVTYKIIDGKIGIKVESRIGHYAAYAENLDNIRREINRVSTSNSYQNPGLYADAVIHKVYMDITETGTEAAASTAASISRDGNKVTFRVDVPFFFFIRNEETKTITFWGSVFKPTPTY